MPHEAYPLSWPDDQPRTRPQDQKPMASWKRTANQYRDQLALELRRIDSPSFVISSNVPLNLRGGMSPGVEPRDVGVSVWFSRAVREDFAWQDALGLHMPAPTEDQINDAFRMLAKRYHPDAGGDIAMFQQLVRHRDNAIRWATRSTNQSFNYVIACDSFREVRLNIAAIVGTLKALRQIERCGTSSLLERAFKGFSAIAEKASA